MPLIECKHLCFGYTSTNLFTDLNFEVRYGDFISIMGSNGSGKSTLMRCLAGLQKPTDGKIVRTVGRSKNGLGYMPQQFEVHKDFPASVLEVVMSGCTGYRGWKPFFTNRDKERAMTKLASVGMAHFHKNCFRELSGGQQQKVLIARALTASVSVLLLDEPTSNLDEKSTEEIMQTIKEINTSLGITIVMVTHQFHHAFRFSNKVLMLTPDGYTFDDIDTLKLNRKERKVKEETINDVY